MQELIDQLTAKAGISSEQATKCIETIKDFVKEKFPMLGGAVDKMFGEQTDNDAAQTTTDPPKQEEHGFMDKIKEMIPGGAAEKAEEVFDGLKDKIGGFFGGDKK